MAPFTSPLGFSDDPTRCFEFGWIGKSIEIADTFQRDHQLAQLLERYHIDICIN